MSVAKRIPPGPEALLCVPELEQEPWPTLGPQVCAFIEAYLVHGPGDLRAQPARIDAEKRALIYRAYEVHPICPGGKFRRSIDPTRPGAWECKRHSLGSTGACPTGRRRFDRVGISLLKGSAKTELAAWIAIVELDKEGPVRCDGFDAQRNPVGRPVIDPYIPMVAYTEEQSEDLAYGALYAICLESKIVDHFDIGLDRVMRIAGDGKATPLASAPNSRDGAKTTFQHFDETHRLTLPRLKNAHTTMLANVPKRFMADAWTLETTTAPAPGEASIAEDTMAYARAVKDGRVKDSRLFFFHRQASDHHDLTTPEGRRAAFVEAAGPLVDRYDVTKVTSQWDSPTADVCYLERCWLNRPVQSAQKAFSILRWRSLVKPGHRIPPGALITLGFDGARYRDAVALVATDVLAGFQEVFGLWEKPFQLEVQGLPWEAPELEIDAVVKDAFTRYRVWRMYADPPYWESTVAKWAGEYGDDRVIRWYTNRWLKIAYAVRAFANAITDGHVTHNGNADLDRHIANSFKKVLSMQDEHGVPYYAIQKERPDSPNKIDGAMGSVLSWTARCDAIAGGAGKADDRSPYEDREPAVMTAGGGPDGGGDDDYIEDAYLPEEGDEQ